MLIGSAVGGGSTLFEEFAYGGDATALTRLFLVTFHGLLGVIMAGSVGMAKYKKVNGKGSGVPEYVISFVLPVVLHLVYDVFTGSDPMFFSMAESGSSAGADEVTDEQVGLILVTGLIIIGYFVCRIVALIHIKKRPRDIQYDHRRMIPVDRHFTGYADDLILYRAGLWICPVLWVSQIRILIR